jgi:hypothetical protein
MHKHDPDLNAALAAGDLGDAETRAAEESIAGCDDCLAEVKAQHLALAAIEAAPRPGLSMSESADLRRAVAGAVGLATEPEPQRSRRPWLGLATAAAVVVALIAVAPVVNLLSTGSDAGSASETTVGEFREVSTSLVAEAPPTSAASAAEAPRTEAPAAAGESTADLEDTAAALGGGDSILPDSYLDFGRVDDLQEFLAEVPLGITDRTTSRSLTNDEILYYSNRFSVEADETAASGCSAAGALAAVAAGDYVITIGTAQFGEIDIVVALVATGGGGEIAVAIDAATCEVLAQVDV